MNTKHLRSTIAAILLVATAGCEATAPQPPHPTASTAHPHSAAPLASNHAASVEQGPLVRVADPSLVCMVNNQFMGSPQIPVQIEGRTYFGCCEMCKGRLTTDPTSRTAVDPVSRARVDKATSVIGKTPNGKTLYFENEQTFSAYQNNATL